jgi:hypothetical protein
MMTTVFAAPVKLPLSSVMASALYMAVRPWAMMAALLAHILSI